MAGLLLVDVTRLAGQKQSLILLWASEFSRER